MARRNLRQLLLTVKPRGSRTALVVAQWRPSGWVGGGNAMGALVHKRLVARVAASLRVGLILGIGV